MDILRGLASLAVVVWHYQHFFYVAPDALSPSFDRTQQPLYMVLWPIYEYGIFAVYLFFVLSGFVFYYVYSEKVRKKEISTCNFIVYRFSRLYPLHVATLLYVAFFQWIAHTTMGAFVVYQFNDLWHFFLNIFLASDWGFQSGHSFNAPIWSVSIEVLLYAIFFILMRVSGAMVTGAIVMVGIGGAAAILGKAHMGWGLYCFFAGGIAFIVYDTWRRMPRTFRLVVMLAGAILLGCAFLQIPFPPDFAGKAGLFGICFPIVVLLLAMVQTYFHNVGHHFKIIGDITYATYLIHFPIQLTIIVAAAYWGFSIDYESRLFFFLFLGITILVSIPTYYLFELPAQMVLRRVLQSRDFSEDAMRIRSHKVS